MLYLLFAISLVCAAAAELPVRQVVLYKHGVGFFERSGELGPGESARLDFKVAEMNDVLKSLTLDVRGGAGVAGLRYDSAEPVSRKLSQLPITLGERQSVTVLLDQWKGAMLEIKTAAQTVTGAIIGARVIPATQERAERETVTLLNQNGEIATHDLAGASLRFPDPKLQQVLRDYLLAWSQARSTDKRSVYIDSTDTGRRQVAASYMIPMPVWKSSYRLLLPATGEPVLEGWAVVDNTTGEDWTNVALALVSGRPISFISALYEPKYIQRPLAQLDEDRVLGPSVHGGALRDDAREIAQNRAQEGRLRAAADPPRPGERFSALTESADAVMMKVAPSIIAATSQGRELGDLFEYRFEKPVTVRKNESAMLPFLQQKVTARKLLIYSDHSSPHPRNAAELTNGTGKTLDGGPVTVYDAGAYGGEALFETIKAGDKRLLSYSVDLGTRISTLLDSKSDLIREVHFRRGVLTTRTAVLETATYTMRNVDAKPKTLVLEHPVRAQYKLLNQKPVESTTTAHRFEVRLRPSATDSFPVQEEHLIEQTHAIANLTPDFLGTVIQNRSLSVQGRTALTNILDRKRQVAQIQGELSRVENEANEMVRDQDRIRQNLASLNRVAGQQDQVQRYAKQLSDQEVQLAQLRDRIAELRKRKAAVESELNSLIESTEF